MRRPGTPLTQELLMEEARFILRTLLRDDLFGQRVRLTEAERVLDGSISLTFADYCGFLHKYGYVRVDQLANLIEVTEGGSAVAAAPEDHEFSARIQRHFARELGTAVVPRRLPGSKEVPAVAAPASSQEPPVAAPQAQAPQPTAQRPRPSAAAGDIPSQIPIVTGLEEILDRRYRRSTALGAGPIGAVYEGEHIALGRPVAIKEARSIFQFVSYLKRDEIVRRLRSTVQKHSLLAHANIVQIIDQNHEREFPYFVMEYASGGNLRKRLGPNGENRLPLAIVVRILFQMCYALKYAHAQGVLHLGLKPENVCFDHFGNVKLTDFGFSRVTEREDESQQAPVLLSSGTVGYMAPERIQPSSDARVISPASDIYAIGILCYEMLTGKLPGRRSPLPSQARKDVPALFDDVFDRMTRDDLRERYESIDQVLAGLYKAFPSTEVFRDGTLLLWAADPGAISPADGLSVPNPAPVVSAPLTSRTPGLEPGMVVVAPTESEAKTGEVDVSSHAVAPRPAPVPQVSSPPPAPAPRVVRPTGAPPARKPNDS